LDIKVSNAKIITEKKNAATMSPGSCALSGILSQLSPASFVWSRMAGLPTIHPSLPLKLTELKR
jgi:hypothetical protein